MSIEEKIDIIGDSLSDIKGAIIAKGVTPSGNITTYAAAIGDISGGGEPTLQSKSLVVGSTTATTTTITPDNGYDGLSTVTVDMTYVVTQINSL